MKDPPVGNFEHFWKSCEKTIEGHLKNPALKEQILNALEQYLVNRGPTIGVYALSISSADPVTLRTLNCAYDAWSLLVEYGRTPRVRGSIKTGRWETHEKPMIESYRWEVKARLARGWQEKCQFFDAAKEAASVGDTYHSYNRTRHLEAHSLRYLAESRIRESKYSEAAALFARSRELAAGTDLESFVGFRESYCILIDAELRLDFESSVKAHSEAVEFMELLPNPKSLFVRPNPWTSPQDFKNERLFIGVMSDLRKDGMPALESAMADLRKMATVCNKGLRQVHLEILRLFLEGLQAFSVGHQALLEDRLAQISKSMRGPYVLQQWCHLHENLLRLRTARVAESQVLAETIQLFPFHASGSGATGIAPLLHGAPYWLQRLQDSAEPGAWRLLVVWYTRLLLDYAYSIHEKNAQEEGRTAMPRPRFREMSLVNLHGASLTLSAALKWEDRPGNALRVFIESLSRFAFEDDLDGSDFEEHARLFVRNTEMLFPLVLTAECLPKDEIVLKRVDESSDTYKYSIAEIDPRTRRSSGSSFVYVKGRYRRSLHAPRDAENRPLYLYPAPACPKFSCTCMIVEGASDVAFFRIILDRIQPGWQALRSEAHPSRAAIEIREARGANEFPRVYKEMRKEGYFHISTPELDAGSERIVLLLDEDHAPLLSDVRSDISRARHKVVLHPDLERIAPQALEASMGSFLGRPLSREERTLLKEWIPLSGHEFESRVLGQWGVYLKRQKDPLNAVPFATHLAKNFPKPAEGRPWNRVWDACNRLLLLAMGGCRIGSLADL